MQKWYVLILSLFYWGVHSNAAPGEEPQPTISFSQARELILSNNPGLKSTATEMEAAKAGVAQAGVFRNPEVGIALERFGANELETTVGQTFELGGKRQIRAEAAQKEYDATVNTRALSRLELEAEIVRRFIPVAAVQRKIVLLDSIIGAEEAVREQIQLRVEAGAVKKTDLVRAEIEIEQLSLERSELVRESDRARQRFAALGAGNDTGLLHVSGAVADEIPLPSLDDFLGAVMNNPVVKATTIARERFETQKKLLKAEITPDLTATAGYLCNNVEGYNAPMVGLSMNIPVFNKNSAAQQRVELLQQAADQRRENTLRLIGAEVRSLYGRLLEIDKKVLVLQSSTLPKAGQVYAMLQEYYDAGNVGFLDLSTARSEMLRLRMAILEIQTERALTLVDLVQTTSLHIQIVK